MLAGFLVTMGTLGDLNRFERHYTRSPSRSRGTGSALLGRLAERNLRLEFAA